MHVKNLVNVRKNVCSHPSERTWLQWDMFELSPILGYTDVTQSSTEHNAIPELLLLNVDVLPIQYEPNLERTKI